MKTEITSFDLAFVVQELQPLVGERIDKIAILEDRSIIFMLGKKTFQAAPGKCWMPLTKPEAPEKLNPFAAFLRKHVGNGKVTKIEQVCSERIIAFHIDRSQKHFILYIELFARGNIVLCDEAHIVVGALAQNQRVQPKQIYQMPKSIDTFHIDEKNFVEQFVQSKENVTKTLAVQFGLGKLLAEELCVFAGISSTAPISEESAHDIFHALQKIIKQPLSPQLVYEDNILIDATPIPFNCYANKKRENVQTFGEALARVFALSADDVKEHKLTPIKQKIEKIETMIELQQKRLAELEQQAIEEHRKGEFMYEHYQEIKQLLADIAEAKKKISWKEIKEKFKQIKEINEATGNVVVEF